jgi:ABC-type antimicrobial peptide transport system permease subunit
MLAAAILVGALTVGDSVRYTLRRNALLRLGGIDLALMGQSRFVRERLGADLAAELKRPVAPAILLRGTCVGTETAATDDQTRTEDQIPNPEHSTPPAATAASIVGVEETFWSLGGGPSLLQSSEESVVVNERLARTLGVGIGEELLLRVEKPGAVSRDAPLTSLEDASAVLRLPVKAIATDAQFGRFGLDADPLPPNTVFVPLRRLQEAIDRRDRVNTLLVGTAATTDPRSSSQEPGARSASAASPERSEPRAERALERHWRLADAGLELRSLPGRNLIELRTERVFLEPVVEPAGRAALPGARGVLTYFVNELRIRDRATPYSTVSALEGAPLPPGMRDDEIVINEWLANDLKATVGDSLRLTYYVVGTMRRLREETATFRVRSILPLAGPAADRDLMPAIPGLTDSENCRDWDPGVPIKLDRIRDRDEKYWDAHRGTPKAFITLNAGQRLWKQRFGELTAMRGDGAESERQSAELALLQQLRPADLGLGFTPVREHAVAASAASIDFGMLFLGFSIFLIVAALLLTGLLFGFGVEQRREEVGVLLALGFTRRRVGRLLLLEGGMLALAAALLGTLAGVLYTRIVLYGLSNAWRGAVGGARIDLHVEPATLLIGAAAAFLVALLTIGLVVRRQSRQVVRALLQGSEADQRPTTDHRPPTTDDRARGAQRRRGGRLAGIRRLSTACRLLPTAYCLLALVLIVVGLVGSAGAAPGLFFGAGSLLLLAGLGASRSLIVREDARRQPASGAQLSSLAALGRRNSARRPGRSVATMALLACGSFLVIAVGANRHDPTAGAEQRSSGTGGFALYGESALPIYQDLNSEQAWDAFGMEPEQLRSVQIVALRVREGDDASCLNLARARAPRLLGVPVGAFRERRAFTFTKTVRREENPWDLLAGRESDGAVPAVGDVNTVVWSLRKSVGDSVDYVDERGERFRVRIVGIIANSILQGSLLISEENLLARYPSQEGYQAFLVDIAQGSGLRAQGPEPREAQRIAAELAYGLQDAGMELTPAVERLAAFNAVEETYLSIFAALGGLGLLLGSVGLGIVVLRNVLERRGELGLLRAVGFPRRALQWLLFSEHALLLTFGLGVGVIAGLIAVTPALRSPGVEAPIASIAATLGAVFASGFLWTWGAAVFALRGPLLVALRDE